jgi:hypothetical protein
MKKLEFQKLYLNTLSCYSENHQMLFPNVEEITEELFQNLETIEIIHILDTYVHSNEYVKSILNRILGVKHIIESRESNSNLDLMSTWKYISNSIKLIPIENTISSIGSQGFLSIPLYKMPSPLEEFDFIRLHIWDDSLNKYIDQKKREEFSIHSHSFHADSWIITGKIINQTYVYDESEGSDFSLFNVEYNKSINKVNQHTSVAVNQGVNLDVQQLSDELHFMGSHYEVLAGHLHKSGHKNSPSVSATFFSFTGKNGLDKSTVVGPRSINESLINRNIYINPTDLLDKIEKQIMNG